MKLNNVRPWYLYMFVALFGLCGFALLINTNAYFWDSRKLNWVPLVAGIVFMAIAVFLLVKVIKGADEGMPDK